jgi:predicted dehydrogenase
VLPSSLAVIGCGAISEEYYLPALLRLPRSSERVWLVDPSQRRLDEVVRKFGFASRQAVRSIGELPDSVSVGFNATPSHLHLESSLDLIQRKINVFLEKPLAETGKDAHQIVGAAQDRVLLSANQFRRRFPAYIAVKNLIQQGKLGNVRAVQWTEGYKFDWPAQSSFYFRRPWPENKPRGVLLDFGSHVIDVICWWLGAKPDVVQAETDGFGGPEAFVSAALVSGDTKIDVKLSYLTKLRNEYIVEGESGRVRGAALDQRRFYFKPTGGPERAVQLDGPEDKSAIAWELVENFERASRGQAELLINVGSVLDSIIVIDQIYSSAKVTLPEFYKEWSR